MFPNRYGACCWVAAGLLTRPASYPFGPLRCNLSPWVGLLGLREVSGRTFRSKDCWDSGRISMLVSTGEVQTAWAAATLASGAIGAYVGRDNLSPVVCSPCHRRGGTSRRNVSQSHLSHRRILTQHPRRCSPQRSRVLLRSPMRVRAAPMPAPGDAGMNHLRVRHVVENLVDKRLPVRAVAGLESRRDVDQFEGASIRGGDHVLLLRPPRPSRWHAVHSGGMAGPLRLSDPLPLSALPGTSRARSGLAPLELAETVRRIVVC